VNISSVRAQLGINAGYSAYVAAKGAVSSLTRQWATEWAKYGITVNAIAPTFVDTPQVAMLLGDPGLQVRPRQSGPTAAGSARPATSSGPSSSSPRMPRRS
jgi:NAD(P)-dependent dehydrogenase (short-subunit alcohol dehydrogenase family)